MKLLSKLLLLLVVLSSFHYNNVNKVDKLILDIPESMHNHYLKELEDIGVIVLDYDKYLKYESDYLKVLNIDFDSYRSINESVKIDLVNGFKLELYSFNKMTAEGLEFDQAELQHKKVNYDPNLRFVDEVRLDINLGKKDLSGQEKWKID